MSVFEFTITESPKIVSFAEYLDYLIIERINELWKKIIREDEEYQKLEANIANCYKELAEILPKTVEIENVIDTLSIDTGSLETLLQKLAYWQGLKDGVQLTDIIGNH